MGEGPQERSPAELLAAWRDRPGCEVNDRWAVIHWPCDDVLPGLPAGAVDHVITDPPYSEHIHRGARSSGRAWLPVFVSSKARSNSVMDLGFEHLDADLRLRVSAEFARLARRWTMAFSDVEGCHLWRDDLEVAGLDYVRTMIWRRLGGAPQFTGDRPASGFECITLAHPKRRKVWNGGGKHGVYEFPIVLNRGGNHPREHTTPKPEALMLALVEDFTDEGEIILDPFAGSGTTGVAALRLGRRAILIEKDPKYAALCIERMKAEEAGSTLQARRAGQLPLIGEPPPTGP